MIRFKHQLKALTLIAAAQAIVSLCPLAAQAADFSFVGQAPSGTDPLGGGYAIGANAFGLTSFDETAQQQNDPTQDVAFHSSGSGLAYATAFTFTETGADDPINADFGSGFTHDIPDGQGDTSDWTASFTGDGQVSFAAPGGETLVTGDQFFVTVGLTNPLPADFAYTITWSDAPAVSAAPEPATWALMVAGVGMLGAAMRLARRRNAVAQA